MIKVIAQEFILHENLNGLNCHASHCLPLPDESVYSVWFEGTKEGENDVCIWGARRHPDGNWSIKQRITEEDNLPHWNPVLFQLDQKTVILFYKKGAPISQWYTMYQISTDNCKTWSQASELVPGDRGGRGPVRNKVIRLSNQWLAAPASLESHLWTMFADISRDNAKTWEKSNEVQNFYEGDTPRTWWDKKLERSFLRKKRGVIQPAFWESDPGQLHALMRSSEGRIYYSSSSDYGQHWTKPQKTVLANNNSGIDAVRTEDGRVFLVYNPVQKNWGKRYPISLAMSTNNGDTWNKVMDLQKGAGKDEFSYPCIQSYNNRLYITYTYNRINIAFWILEL